MNSSFYFVIVVSWIFFLFYIFVGGGGGGTRNSTQGLKHAWQVFYHWVTPLVLLKFYLNTGSKLYRLALSLGFSCITFPSTWDYRCPSLTPNSCNWIITIYQSYFLFYSPNYLGQEKYFLKIFTNISPYSDLLYILLFQETGKSNFQQKLKN